MYLGQNDEPAPSENPSGNPSGAKQFYLEWRDIFKCDLRFLGWAVLRRKRLLILIPVVCAAVFFTVRTITTPKIYVACTALVRQEQSNLKKAELPTGYQLPRFPVVFNMALSRKSLEETVRRLDLPWSRDQLFNSITIQPAAKNSNYFYIMSKTGNPKLSAQIANTLSEVFLEEYKGFINDYMKESLDGLLRNQTLLKNEIESLQLRMKSLCEKNGIFSFETEMTTVGQRISEADSNIGEESVRIKSLKVRIADLTDQLGLLQEHVTTYSEKGEPRELQIAKAEMELQELLRSYTEKSPEVKLARARVRNLKEAPPAPNNGIVKTGEGLNPQYVFLRNELTRTNMELHDSENRLSEYSRNLEELKKRREILTSQAPLFTSLSEQMEIKKKALYDQEGDIKELEMFIGRSYSDISIHEPADVPSSSVSRKRGLYTVLGFILGLIGALGYVVGKEIFNFSIRSRIDMEQSLHLPSIGMIPELDPDRRSDYYSAIHAFIHEFMNKTAAAGGKRIVAIAPVGSLEGFESVLSEFFEIANINNMNCLHIKPAPPDFSDASRMINDFIYKLSDETPKPGPGGELYFKLDDMAFLAPPTHARIQNFYERMSEYTLIVWELFPYDAHTQLFCDICGTAAMTVIPIRYNTSSKWYITRVLKQLRKTCGGEMISGLLFAIENNVYRRINQ